MHDSAQPALGVDHRRRAQDAHSLCLLPEAMAPHDDDSDGSIGIFEEPVDFYEPEKKPTEVEHRMQNGQTLKLRLVGHSPLWVGNYLVSRKRSIILHTCYT